MGTYSITLGVSSGWRERFAGVRDRDGEHVGRGRNPVINVTEALELASVLEVTAPGIDTYYEDHGDGHHTAWLVHPDGSWARASAFKDEAPIVHQGGPRRLWDILDEIRPLLAHPRLPSALRRQGAH